MLLMIFKTYIREKFLVTHSQHENYTILVSRVFDKKSVKTTILLQIDLTKFLQELATLPREVVNNTAALFE